MDHLTMELVKLCRRNRNGSLGTQNNRQRGLTAMAYQLNQMGYQLKSARSLKPKHIDALVELWQDEDCTSATIRNRLSWLRWWGEKVNKASIIARENRAYNAADRDKNEVNRAQALDQSKLATIECPHVRASLLLQAAFGLRREEAIKFQPSYAIRQNRIRLKSSWTKGGRYREIPITSNGQRHVLNLVQKIAQNSSLIPTDKTYKQHLRSYEYVTLKAGLRNTHGLRHMYAQWRYRMLTGFACPHVGGKHWQEMTPEERAKDRAARQRVSQELGHNRLSITDVYLGRAFA